MTSSIPTFRSWMTTNMMRLLTMILSLTAVSASQRRDFVFDSSVDIPALAHTAYCTAIVGYYDKCTRIADDAPNSASMCDGATYTPLAKPLFIDLVTCYANPNFADGNSVSFFGETPDKKKILEFHIILHDSATSNLKPLNCQPDGSCDCSRDLLTLKNDFLAYGGCSNTDEYSCLSEDWYGDTETCFIPATDITVGNQFRCALTAAVQQYGPCNVILEVPDSAHDAFCTGITGWYDSCSLPDDDATEDECAGNFMPLPDPLWIDLNSCYSNPFMMNSQSSYGDVSFFGKVADGSIREFHMIFLVEASLYRPTDCESTGVCEFPESLKNLKEKFLADGDCQATSEYYCMSELFLGVTEHCFVPATVFLPTGKLACSMTARVEQIEPCDALTTSGSSSIAQTPSPTPYPTPGPTPNPTFSVAIPAAAHMAYCTAIVGYYDKCTRLPDDALITANMCDGATYTPLTKPLFIDLVTCYANPNFADGNSVSFFGETPDKKKILEFHIIFHDSATSNLKPLNCQPDGSCDCSRDLQTLKKQFLAYGGCNNTDDYSCLSEDWYGDTETCFIPATDITVGNQFRCALTANIQQYGPCNVILEIPDSAREMFCTGITGWYDDCKLSPGYGQEECVGNFHPLSDPLWVDLDSCYTNPYIATNSQTFFGDVSFYVKMADLSIREFHMIFYSEGSVYLPTNCQANGACQCSSALNDLKEKFRADGDCQATTDYFCMSELFFGVTDHCFVPATAFLPTGKLACSMTARIEQVTPCDAVTLPTSSAIIPNPSPTPYPVPPPTPFPSTSVVPPTNQPDAHSKENPQLSDDGSVVIPPIAHSAYCTAIMGWYDGCIDPDYTNDPESTMCAEARYYPLAEPEFINLNKCYQNPRIPEHSISFFGKTPDKKKVMEFHLVFKDPIGPPYVPSICNFMGVCECPPAILKLKKKFLADGKCTDGDTYRCTGEDFWGVTDSCFVPGSDIDASEGIACSMVANLQQFSPCDVVLDIPPAAFDTYCTAITGWYSGCVDNSNSDDPMCPPDALQRLNQPLFIDLSTCYKNPTLPAHSVTFYSKDDDGIVTEYNMLFNDGKGEHLIPSNCNLDGACQCPKELIALKKKFMEDGGCSETAEYICRAAPFFGDTDRCYVPLAASFSGNHNFFCSMAAKVEAFEPCDITAVTEAEYRMSLSGAEAWLVSVLVVLVILCTCFVAYVRFIPMYRRRRALARRSKALADEDAEDDVINVAWGGKAYKDDPDGDGVYNETPTRELELNGRKFKGEKFFTVNVIS